MTINGNTRVLGIIGNPVRHTKSPAIHNFLAEKMGLNIVYVPFEVDDNVDCAVKGAFNLGILGMNVTVPWKQEVINALADIDEIAKRIGAVNTLVSTEKGYKGYNTDMSGLGRAIASEGISLSGKRVIMLGAGGAARAVAFLCAKENVSSLTILNRTEEKAKAIIKDIEKYTLESGKSISLKADVLDKWEKYIEDDLIVFQCTKLGLNENDGAPVDDKEFYKHVEYGFDLVYRENTKFQSEVKNAGGKAFTGLKMLVYQAIDAFELWNNISVPDELIKELLESDRI